MKKFRISAQSVGHLEKEIAAENEQEAYAVLERLLEHGEMPETDGWIEEQQVEELR